MRGEGGKEDRGQGMCVCVCSVLSDRAWKSKMGKRPPLMGESNEGRQPIGRFTGLTDYQHRQSTSLSDPLTR